MILKAALKFVEILVLRAKKNSLKICLLFWIAVFFGCNKEVPVPQLNDKNTFHLVVEPSLEQKLYESKSEKYSILNNIHNCIMAKHR